MMTGTSSCRTSWRPKLYPEFNFPYRVVGINLPNVDIENVVGPRTQRRTVHVNRLRDFPVPWVIPTRHSVPDDTQAERHQDWVCRFCKGSYNEDDLTHSGRVWIGCDYCLEWMHMRCAGLAEEPTEELWHCPGCAEHRIAPILLVQHDPSGGHA